MEADSKAQREGMHGELRVQWPMERVDEKSARLVEDSLSSSSSASSFGTDTERTRGSARIRSPET